MAMKKANLLALALLAAPLACAGDPAPQPRRPPPPAARPPSAPPRRPSREPTPEEKKKAEEEKKKAEAARKLAADRAEWEADSKVEAARWTPDALHAEAKKLAAAKYPTLKAALSAALKGKHRKPGEAARDAYRHPLETLEFFGLKPTMTVLEYGPGEGWYTELLAPTLAARGKLLVTRRDPNGPPESRGTFYGQRFKRFLDNAPELYGKVETRRHARPARAQARHGGQARHGHPAPRAPRHAPGQDRRRPSSREAFKALKPGGVLGIEQHRAKPDGRTPTRAPRRATCPRRGSSSRPRPPASSSRASPRSTPTPRTPRTTPRACGRCPPRCELKDKDQAEVRRHRRERSDDAQVRQAEVDEEEEVRVCRGRGATRAKALAPVLLCVGHLSEIAGLG